MKTSICFIFILPKTIVSHVCVLPLQIVSLLAKNKSNQAILVEKIAVQVWDRRINSISYETDSGQISQEVYLLRCMHILVLDKKIS